MITRRQGLSLIGSAVVAAALFDPRQAFAPRQRTSGQFTNQRPAVAILRASATRFGGMTGGTSLGMGALLRGYQAWGIVRSPGRG